MRHKRLKLIVAFLFFLGLKGLQAQNMNVKSKSGTQTTYDLNNIKKMSFSLGNITISKTTGDPDIYALSGIRNINFDTSSVAYQINAGILPASSGTITGAGTFNHEAFVSLVATAATGYTFVNWTENGIQVSTNATYSFTANENRSLVANFELQTLDISASVSPANSGTIIGSGNYNYGETVDMIAMPETGYDFANWTENGIQVSTNATYSFTANENRSLVANFELQILGISASVSPANSGTIIGSGNYNYGETAELIAIPETGYDFVNWTEDGEEVSTNSSYNFTVNSNLTLVANFLQTTSVNGLSNPNSGPVFFPNPVKDILNIDLTGITVEGVISILSINGKLMHTQHTIANSGLVTLNLSQLPKGIYLCRYLSTTEVKRIKIIKQ